jgi:hypothetical protein
LIRYKQILVSIADGADKIGGITAYDLLTRMRLQCRQSERLSQKVKILSKLKPWREYGSLIAPNLPQGHLGHLCRFRFEVTLVQFGSLRWMCHLFIMTTFPGQALANIMRERLVNPPRP